jgi:branched-chain amino acid transport system ATP-binding protein
VNAPETLLTVRNLEARYDRFPALDRVSLEVHPGEIVCLLGSNGAGKTTLIRAILGILHPAAGEVWLFGRRVDGWRPHAIQRLGVGVVPVGRRLFSKMSVYENLLMGALRERDLKRVKEREQPAELFDPLPRAFSGAFPQRPHEQVFIHAHFGE